MPRDAQGNIIPPEWATDKGCIDQRFSITVVAIALPTARPVPKQPTWTATATSTLVVNSFGWRGINPTPVQFPPGSLTVYWNGGRGIGRLDSTVR